MNKVYSLFGFTLLLINGIGAVYGGVLLVIDPSGGRIGLSPDWLAHSPFETYLIPGLVLLMFNGISSLSFIVFGLLNKKAFSMLLIFQGSILVTWIVVQVIMIRYTYFLHYVMGSVGILMILSGLGLQPKRGH